MVDDEHAKALLQGYFDRDVIAGIDWLYQFEELTFVAFTSGFELL